MKHRTHRTVAILAALAFTPGLSLAQQALKTDNAGQPITPLDLSGGNVTGTLAAARLPAPVVQTIAQTQGSVTLAAGTNVAVLTAPLTGTLNLRLPAASSYAAGRVLVVIDPGGYSNEENLLAVQPSGADLINGDAGLLPVLGGTGAASLYPDGANRWTVGQSHLRAPTAGGLTLAGPATTADTTVLSIRNGTDQEIFSVRGDGTTSATYLAAIATLSSDAELIYSDGDGGLSAETVSTIGNASYYFDLQSVGSKAVSYSDNAARLYFAGDGSLHVRTPDHVDHVLSWTTAP